MALTKPIMSLGLDISNPTFSVPVADLSGLAAGWAGSGASTTPYGSDLAGWTGHDRIQYFTIAAATTYTLVGSPCSTYLLCTNASTRILGALVSGVSGVASTTINLYIRWYRAIGTAISDSLVHTTTGAASLGLTTTTSTITVPANAVWAAPVITIVRTSTGTSTVSLAFAGLGCWDSSTSGSWQWARFPSHPGTSARKTAEVGMVRPTYGPSYSIDRTRYGKPFRMTFALSGWTTTEKSYLEKAWSYNVGRSIEVSQVVNPSGGVWPIIVLPGLTGAPPAMLMDFEQRDQFPMDIGGAWYSDPPIWSGAVSMIERV